MKKMIGLCVGALAMMAALCQAQTAPKPAAPTMTLTKMDTAKQKDWLARWDKEICSDTKAFRECDRVVGQDVAFVTVTMNDDTRVQILRMWSALIPFDVEIQKNFEAAATPDTWFGFSSVPFYLMLQSEQFRR